MILIGFNGLSCLRESLLMATFIKLLVCPKITLQEVKIQWLNQWICCLVTLMKVTLEEVVNSASFI